jgi:hypothetical protein
MFLRCDKCVETVVSGFSLQMADFAFQREAMISTVCLRMR